MVFDYNDENGARLDVYLASVLENISRSGVQKLANAGKITVNGKPEKSNYRLVCGDRIEFEYMESSPSVMQKENIPLDIVYEDDDLLVINKPKGMACHPAPGTPDHTLANALLYHSSYLSAIGGEDRPGIVHRLDKNTSGLLVAAKKDTVHRLLSEALQKREITRKYKALVWGEADFEEAKIDMPLGRDPKDRKKQAVIDDENLTKRDAVTYVKLLKKYSYFSLLECRLDTGRTHQIRVHLSYIGYPVVGDEEYKGVKRKLPFPLSKKDEFYFRQLIEEGKGQMLHAYSLSFVHPVTGEKMHFEVPLPQAFQNMLDFAEKL